MHQPDPTAHRVCSPRRRSHLARLAPVALLALAALTISGCLTASSPGAAPAAAPGAAGLPTPVSFANLPPPPRTIATTVPISAVAPQPAAAPAAPVPPPPAAEGGKVEPRVGFMAPDFELEKVDGSGTVKLSELRGKPVFINFWATWCGPCKVEMPDIELVHQAYKDQGVTILGVDVQEPAAKVQDFLKPTGYSWQFILDKNSDTLRQYRVTGIPSSFFIDKDGVIRDIVIGYTSRNVMEAKLKPLLNLN